MHVMVSEDIMSVHINTRYLNHWLFLLAWLLAATAAMAIPDAEAADAQTRTDEAEAMSEAAKQKAKSKIGYADAYGSQPTSAEFNDLSQQISRLAAIMRSFTRTINPNVVPGALDMAVPQYGPNGPTVKSVRLILEYRLMVGGNPRLKVGKISESKTSITAQVLTTDGSLVEAYAIDKKTGIWSTVR